MNNTYDTYAEQLYPSHAKCFPLLSKDKTMSLCFVLCFVSLKEG